MEPTVSVLLPNLNNRKFLEERLDSILQQTLESWELIVVDNFSEDGAWELIRGWPDRDRRIVVSQAPREGMYANWNNCIRKARGRYVYIATSDDNMAPDCLEKLASALDQEAHCGLAHCPLRMINAEGEEFSNWWQTDSVFARSTPGWLARDHIRYAPLDGVLHLTGDTVYTSITQLLIRRSLFAEIGLFENRWGSVGDFNWDMRASLSSNTAHVASTWGGWRVYPAQATALAALGSADHAAKIDEMIADAVTQTAATQSCRLSPDRLKALAALARDHRGFSRKLKATASSSMRKIYIARSLLAGARPAWQHVTARLRRCSRWHESSPEVIQEWLTSAALAPGALIQAREKCSPRIAVTQAL